MTIKDWLDLFKKHKDIKIFYLNHLRLFTGMKQHTLNVCLKRLNEKKVIQRICRGYYANPFNLPTLEEISSIIYSPSYISLESALSRWGMLSQIPQILTCVTTKLPRKFNTVFGVIEYHQIKKEYFWGFVQEGSYFIATSEKTLLDYIYIRKEKDIKKVFSGLDLKDLNLNKLKSFAKRMNIALRRLLQNRLVKGQKGNISKKGI